MLRYLSFYVPSHHITFGRGEYEKQTNKRIILLAAQEIAAPSSTIIGIRYQSSGGTHLLVGYKSGCACFRADQLKFLGGGGVGLKSQRSLPT